MIKQSSSPAVRIDNEYMERLRKESPGYSDSVIIQSSVMYTLLFCCDTKKGKNEEGKIKRANKNTIRKMAQDIKSSGTIISYRMPDEILNKVGLFYANKNETLTKTQVIKCCLAQVLYLLEKNDSSQLESIRSQINDDKKEANLMDLLMKLDHSSYTKRELARGENIAYRSGIKSYTNLSWLLETINEVRKEYEIENYIEPCMGTGNVLCHLSPFTSEELNDSSEDMVHLLTILRDHTNEFIEKLMALDVDEKTFSNQQKRLEKIKKKYERKKDKKRLKKIRNKNENIDKAVAYYYVLLLSHYGDCKYFKGNATNKTLLKKACILQQVGERLHKTTISHKNAFDLLRELKELGDKRLAAIEAEDNEPITDELKATILAQYLIYLDPPYIGTEKYYDDCRQNGGFSHEILKELIDDLRVYGVKFIISYRATVTDNNKCENSEIQDKLNKLYEGQGFFIKFKKVENEQIEILLTSVQVSGSTPYDCDIDELIELWKMENVVFDRYNRTADITVIRKETPVPITWAIGDALKHLDELYLSTDSYIQFIRLGTWQFKLNPLTKERAKNVRNSIPYIFYLVTYV